MQIKLLKETVDYKTKSNYINNKNKIRHRQN